MITRSVPSESKKTLSIKIQSVRLFFVVFMILCLSSLISAPVALFLGIGFAGLLGNPYLTQTRIFTQRLLQFSVIGLGAGMNLSVITQAGIHGILYTAFGIAAILLLGFVIGQWLKTDRNISLLIAAGTAICGGSAIAAIAPVIRAKPDEISVALATVFCLNAVAIFIFVPIGHYFNLTQLQFGMWSALAIHDTSSVIGSAMQYGSQAVDIAITLKLVRALWIIPVVLLVSLLWRKQDDTGKGKTKFPWFIMGFILAAGWVTYFPSMQSTGLFISLIAKKVMILTLFLIGSTCVHASERLSMKSFIQGSILWILTASGTLIAIVSGLI